MHVFERRYDGRCRGHRVWQRGAFDRQVERRPEAILQPKGATNRRVNAERGGFQLEREGFPTGHLANRTNGAAGRESLTVDSTLDVNFQRIVGAAGRCIEAVEAKSELLPADRVHIADLDIADADLVYGRQVRATAGRSIRLGFIGRHGLEFPVGDTLGVLFRDQVNAFQNDLIDRHLTGQQRQQRNFGGETLDRNHFRPRAPGRVGETYPFDLDRRGQRDFQVEVTGDLQFTAGGFLGLLGNQTLVLVEIQRHQDGDAADDDGDHDHHDAPQDLDPFIHRCISMMSAMTRGRSP